MSKKKDINKGLRSLLSNIEKANTPEKKSVLVKELSSNIAMIPVSQIEANPFQPRTAFDPQELEELSQSIKTYGLIQPITVRSMGGDQYQLISGERRWRASQVAGLVEVPAYIRLANDQEMLEMALVENIQRSDLNAIEVAISYQRLMDECKLTHEALSDRVGKNRSTITNYVRLLKLPPEVQQSVKEGQLSMGHARALAGVEDISLQLDIFKTAVAKGLSVRALENLIKEYNSPTKNTKKITNQLTPDLVKVIDQLSAKFGTKVEVKRSESGKGTLALKFSTDRELNHILDILDGE